MSLGGNAVPHRLGGDRLACTARSLQQCGQTGADGILKQAQAFPDKGPVFPHQRHNVRDGSDGRQISADIQKLVGVAFFHSGTELERHPGTAQKLERAFIIGTVGVHDGHRLGKFSRRQVVVGDHQIDAQLFCIGGFLHRRNAVIHRNDELEAFTRQLFQRCAVKTVAPLRAAAAVCTGPAPPGL